MKNGQQAKAWCFDNGITEEQVQASWVNAIAQDNFVITNMSKNGKCWRDLPTHLLEQLVERY